MKNGVEDYFDAVVDAALPPCNSPNPNGNINTGNTAKDAYNVLLNYYTDDYKGIGYSAPTVHAYLQQQGEYRPLYNGNISSMGVNVEKLGSPLLYNYHYDQLNRLVGMQAQQSGNAVWAGLSTIPDFKETISYDPNGNILSYDRNGNNTFAGKPLAMDKLGYRYKPNTNQLDHITDDVNAANYTEDIDGQGTNNYEYDEIGNLVKDKADGIGQSQQSKIEWTVYGKISSIKKDNGMLIAYTYDAGGNRISKAVSNDGGTTTTWYVRDAGGNVMGVYVSGDNTKNSGRLTQTETHLYGSSRLGLYKAESDVTLAATNTATLAGGKTAYLYSFTRGEKFFELSNHLGNVLAVVTDKKLQHTEDNSTVDYYLADVASASDYAPFGMQLVGRSVSADGYRYGFNGKEKDNDMHSLTAYDYGFRIYNPAIGKFLSEDPLTKKYPYYTPYQFAGNSPIANVDLDGLEEVHYLFVWVKDESTGREAVLKLGGQMIGTPTGKVDKNGVMEYKEPYKIYAHYPAQAFGETHLVTATYNSEEEFQQAKASDFYGSAITVGANRGAEIANKFGELLSIGYITSSLTFLGKEALALYVEQKLAQYSVNLVNKQALQNLINQNIRQQILKSSGITAEAKLAAIEESTVGAHFLSRHGAQTTLQQQLTRATTGLTPDGVVGRAVASSRFLTHEFEVEALEKAQAAYTSALAGNGTVIDMGKVIGEGYLRGGGAVQTSTKVQVYYNASGEVITLFPKLQ